MDTYENEITDEKHISISKMAFLHDISRQTLIYYDHINLFKPVYTNESGYRYYSVYQIPFLREICLMKNLGFTLDEIKENIENRTTDSACELMTHKLEKMEAEIKELERKRTYLEQRRAIYKGVSTKIKNVNLPCIEWIPERQVIFVPFEKDEMEKGLLHLTLMKAWKKSFKHEIIPANGFGSLIRYSSIIEGCPLKNAGSIINLPDSQKDVSFENCYTIPEGEYVVMYKYGMPYDMEPLRKLLQWIDEKHLQVPGDDIVDLCLLDTTFYDISHTVDFCVLQVPIK
jgi:DNA-binding transcriptional MerR regulator